MSRNFELLRRVEKEQELLGPSSGPKVPANGGRGQPNLEALAQEEAIKLVQRVFLVPSPGAPRVVVFSGVEHGAGCSSICARASEVLAAQVAGSVCAVDANLRSPFLHQYFDVDNHRGLTDSVLQSGPVPKFAQRVAGGNLWLVPYGSLASDPQTLLKSSRLQSWMADLRAAFDYILLDAPPVNLYADAITVGQLTDGVILVVATSTRREAARRAKASLEAAKVRLLGAVLNKRTFPIPEAIYRRL